jgi:hypothetical protein
MWIQRAGDRPVPEGRPDSSLVRSAWFGVRKHGPVPEGRSDGSLARSAWFEAGKTWPVPEGRSDGSLARSPGGTVEAPVSPKRICPRISDHAFSKTLDTHLESFESDDARPDSRCNGSFLGAERCSH